MSNTALLAIDPRGVATIMLNGPERHNAFNAELIGRLHDTLQQLDQAIEREVDLLLQGGPLAQQTCKILLREVAGITSEQRDLITARTARALAQLRSGDEGREGLAAFLEKRKPNWSP